MRKIVQYGLSEKNALKALTATPAHLIGVADKVGSIKKGMIANFFITSDNLFNDFFLLLYQWKQKIGHQLIAFFI